MHKRLPLLGKLENQPNTQKSKDGGPTSWKLLKPEEQGSPFL